MKGLPIHPVCSLCGDDTDVFDASQFRKTLSGSVLCPDCYSGEPIAHPPTEAPRAAEEHQESKGEPTPPGLAGDRAGVGSTESVVVGLVAEACEFKVADLRPFDAVRTPRAARLSVEVEEWVYGVELDSLVPEKPLEDSLVLLRTPREIFPARIARTGASIAGPRLEVCRFVVVLEHGLRGSDVTLRDIGPSFTPRPGSRDDRAAALNTASGWGRSQAARLKADPPRGFRAARELS